jgi:hypothetical protein
MFSLFSGKLEKSYISKKNTDVSTNSHLFLRVLEKRALN